MRMRSSNSDVRLMKIEVAADAESLRTYPAANRYEAENHKENLKSQI